MEVRSNLHSSSGSQASSDGNDDDYADHDGDEMKRMRQPLLSVNTSYKSLLYTKLSNPENERIPALSESAVPMLKSIEVNGVASEDNDEAIMVSYQAQYLFSFFKKYIVPISCSLNYYIFFPFVLNS